MCCSMEKQAMKSKENHRKRVKTRLTQKTIKSAKAKNDQITALQKDPKQQGLRILLRPRLVNDPKQVKKHWFYCVFAQNCKKKKNIGFTVFSLKNGNKRWFYFVFDQK